MFNRIIEKKFLNTLKKIQFGNLTVIMPNQQFYEFQGSQAGPRAKLIIYRLSSIISLYSKGDVGFAEAYQAHHIDSPDLVSLIKFLILNNKHLSHYYFGSRIVSCLINYLYHLNINTLKGSKKNIEAHYDLGNEFYELWLDSSMTYSSALYNNEKLSLIDAQMKKYDKMIDSINTFSPRILEIGCGWGGFSRRLIERVECEYKGITLSEQQLNYAIKKSKNLINYRLEDYREQLGSYDYIVSIEMFEAVGEQYWSTYFKKIKELLKPNGCALIQTITINNEEFEQYRKGTDFIRSYIFPGGLLPSENIFSQKAFEAGLQVKQMHRFGQDYALTLSEWLKNFDSSDEKIKLLGYSKQFIRLWRLYLASCVASFSTGKTNVIQTILTHA